MTPLIPQQGPEQLSVRIDRRREIARGDTEAGMRTPAGLDEIQRGGGAGDVGAVFVGAW